MSKKYPRTFHFNFSPEVHSDDKVQYDTSAIIGVPIVITYKLDGGNTTLKAGGPFARSHSERTHCSSFDYIKTVHQFPKEHNFNGLNFHGENMYARHSIAYSGLKDYFYLFGISDQSNFLSWDDTISKASELNFETVPVLFDGVLKSLSELEYLLSYSLGEDCPLGGDAIEGFVVRVKKSFPIADFSKNVIKYVRRGHVQSDEHWSRNWVKNDLLA